MVELALTLPLLALILLGTVDLGRAFFYYTRLSNAVQQGALKGMWTPHLVTDIASDPHISVAAGYPTTPQAFSINNDSVKYRVKQEAESALGLQNKDITVTCFTQPGFTSQKPCNTARRGDLIQVRAEYEFKPLTQQMAGFRSGYKMSKTVKMVIIW